MKNLLIEVFCVILFCVIIVKAGMLDVLNGKMVMLCVVNWCLGFYEGKKEKDNV